MGSFWIWVQRFLRKHIWLNRSQKRYLFFAVAFLPVFVFMIWFQRGKLFQIVVGQMEREICDMYLPGVNMQSDMTYCFLDGIWNREGEKALLTSVETDNGSNTAKIIENVEKTDNLENTDPVWESFYRENRMARMEQSLEQVKQGLEEASGQEKISREEAVEVIVDEQKSLGRADPVTRIALEEYSLYEDLVREFYTIDANTSAGKELLNVETLMGESMEIDKNTDGPQILLYHTHSQEGFTDSDKERPETRIVGVGDELERILTEEYGYQVLHLQDEFDKKSRDDAYSNALPRIREVLEEYPSIQAVIDLHRDEMPKGVRQVTEIDGKPTAKFMFFNGLCWSKKTGKITSLDNPYLKENLALSFQLQVKANSYYPGITRRIYLKQYRYNMHLCPKSMLIELGAQNNTLEEAMNACGPLADILNKVFSGE